MDDSQARIWPAPPTSVLTCRELTIAHMVAQGKPNKIIAYELCLSEQTVKNHTVKICRKIGVRNRLAIALWVIGHKRTVCDVITTIELSEGTKYRDGHLAPAANYREREFKTPIGANPFLNLIRALAEQEISFYGEGDNTLIAFEGTPTAQDSMAGANTQGETR